MSDDACPDCGHHTTIHNEKGCTLSTCDCTTPAPPRKDS